MIRFILPALLLLVASCQVPQNSKSDCCTESATATTAAQSVEDCSDCPSDSAAATATTASAEDCASDSCVMAGTEACGTGDCPMQAACDAGVSACGDGGCDMKAKGDNTAATQAVLMQAGAGCEGCVAAEGMCADCDAGVKAMWANCEGCSEGAFCNDCLGAIKASMEAQCDGGSCDSAAKASCDSAAQASCDSAAKASCDSAATADCATSAAAATATTASAEDCASDSCAMAGTEACGTGDCPMQAACDAGVSACGDGGCDMKAKSDNTAVTKAILIKTTAGCEGCVAAEGMCADCDAGVKAMWANCEGCTEGAFCDDCIKGIKASMNGHCEESKATATKASAETTTKSSCCDTPQG